jgi:ParB/RepB/Spo0J family partition protein
MASSQTAIRALPLSALVLSQTPIQIERRAQFNQDALKELSATIASAGRVEHAITVRPAMDGEVGEKRFEIVDGERRVTATRMAGLSEILAEVRELADDQVEQIQIVTGLQKEGLHELIEAEGYEMLQKRGFSIDEIAHKCGRSKATVYARIKLLELCAEGREAVRAGKISATLGLLLARIPLEKLQKEALVDIGPQSWRNDEPMSSRDASRHIQQRYMLRLDQAPFPTDDATLVKKAGACGSCPKNTASQPELFHDVSSGAMCTDQACFASKKSAHVNRLVAQAKAAGTIVFRGADADRISPHGGDFSLKEGWVPLHTVAKDALAKDAPVALLQLPNDPDKLVKIVRQKDVKKSKAKCRSTSASGSLSPKVDPKEQFAARYHAKLFAEICAKTHRLERWLLDEYAVEQLRLGDCPHDIVKGFGVDPMTRHEKLEKQIRALSDAALQKLLMALLIGWEFGVTNAKPARLLAFAKRYKVNAEKIHKDLEASDKAAQTVPGRAAKGFKKKATKK